MLTFVFYICRVRIACVIHIKRPMSLDIQPVYFPLWFFFFFGGGGGSNWFLFTAIYSTLGNLNLRYKKMSVHNMHPPGNVSLEYTNNCWKNTSFWKGHLRKIPTTSVWQVYVLSEPKWSWHVQVKGTPYVHVLRHKFTTMPISSVSHYI